MRPAIKVIIFFDVKFGGNPRHGYRNSWLSYCAYHLSKLCFDADMYV